MAHRKYDLVQETSTSTGTGAMALAGAPTRRRTFSSVLANADTAYVLIENASAAEWEICLATYVSAGNQLSRGAVLASSTGSTVSFSAGTKTISIIAPASKSVVEDNNGDAVISRYLGVGGAASVEFDINGNTNGIIQGRVFNNNTGLNAYARWALSTGTANSYVVFQIGDNAGSPFAQMASGTSVTQILNDFATHIWRSSTSSEYARLNSTGLGVGISPGYKLHIQGDANTLFSLDRNNATSKKASIAFRRQSNNTWEVGVDIGGSGSQDFYIFDNVAANARLIIDSSGHLLPGQNDNNRNLGSAIYRWSTVYAGTGTINTSGRDLKVGIREASAAERAAARRILDTGPKLYKFKDAVDAKGESARLHAGYIAEDVRDALEAEGLDPWAYGFMCADALATTETYTESVTRPKVAKVQAEERAVEMVNGRAVMVTRTVERDEPVGRMVPVYDENGDAVMVPGGAPNADGEPAMVPMLHFVQDTETVEETRTREVPLLDTEGKPVMRLGLRYSELEAFLKCAAPVAG